MKSETLFGHLGIRLTKNREVLATEALAFILNPSRKREASRKLVQLVNHALGVAFPENLHFRTQVGSDEKNGGDENNRPDISGRDDNGDERLLIEAKFGAGLTKNQPNAYLGRFRTNSHCVLLFIVPERRQEEIWQEVLARCSNKYQPDKIQTPSGWQAAKLRDNLVVALTTWEVVLQTLQEVESQSEIEDVRQLKGLCDRMDNDPFLPFCADNFSPEIPRLIIQLMYLVDAVAEHFKTSDCGAINDARRGMKQDRYERHFSLGRVKAGLRIDYKRWASEHQTPLWLVLYGTDEYLSKCRKRLDEWEDAVPARLLFDSRRIRIPINLPLSVERDPVVKAVVDEINAVAGKLKGLVV